MKKTLGLLLIATTFLVSCSSVPTFSRSALSASVKISEAWDKFILEPNNVPPKDLGVMFYPGGLIQPGAYLLALTPLVSAGYTVVVLKMPFDLAILDAEKGLASKTSVPGVKKWVVGGHSLGGVAAAMAVDKNPNAFVGLVFWASYPAKDNDLSTRSLPTLSISASNDGLSTPAKVDAASVFLPRGTEVIVIKGGNHAQFADYGLQKGDGEATVTRQQQQSEANAALLSFLNGLE